MLLTRGVGGPEERKATTPWLIQPGRPATEQPYLATHAPS
jgi:hypothetical protein